MVEQDYKTNFLTNVVFKVDFPKILELNEQNPPAKLQEKIREKFPDLKEIKKQYIKFDTKLTGENVEVKQEKTISWKFSNKEKTKNVFVDSEFIYLEYNKYTKFQEFLEDIKFIISIFFEIYPVKISKRIGLRYVNQIKLPEGDPLDWNGLINESLFDVTNRFIDEKDNLRRSMHSLEIKENEHNLRFQFGSFNSEYPNTIARKEFVLDYDCYTVEETDITDVSIKAKEFHEIISKWFEKSILDGLRDKMKSDKI